MVNVSPGTMAAIEAELPIGGAGVEYDDLTEAHKRWSRLTIKVTMRALVEEGRVERVGLRGKPLFRRPTPEEPLPVKRPSWMSTVSK